MYSTTRNTMYAYVFNLKKILVLSEELMVLFFVKSDLYERNLKSLRKIVQ